MLPTIAKRMNGVQFSKIRELSEKARTLQESGQQVFSLTLGEPDFNTPDVAQNAAITAMKSGDTHYTPNNGLENLRTALAEKLNEENNIRASADEIIITAGGSEAVLNTILAILNPDDEIIIPSPAWPNYESAAQMAGATPVSVPLVESKGRLTIDAVKLEASISEKTKMLVINTPHNPTGLVLTKDELEKMANVAKKHNLLVLSDEMYEKITSDDAQHYSIASFPGMAERTVTINGFSKAYAMTGWRIGYLHAPKTLYHGIFRIHQFNTACVPAFTQHAALAALHDATADLEQMRDSFIKRRQLLVDALSSSQKLEVMEAKGAIYLFVKINEYEGSIRDFALQMLEDTGVATVPGTAFGEAGEGYLRLSYAASETVILEAAKRIINYLEK